MALLRFSRGSVSLRGTKKADIFSGDASTMTPSGLGEKPDRIINFQPSDRIDRPGDWSRDGKPLMLRRAGTLRISRRGMEFVDLRASAIKSRPNTQRQVAILAMDTGGTSHQGTMGLV